MTTWLNLDAIRLVVGGELVFFLPAADIDEPAQGIKREKESGDPGQDHDDSVDP